MTGVKALEDLIQLVSPKNNFRQGLGGDRKGKERERAEEKAEERANERRKGKRKGK
jgi:hypothetical protein